MQLPFYLLEGLKKRASAKKLKINQFKGKSKKWNFEGCVYLCTLIWVFSNYFMYIDKVSYVSCTTKEVDNLCSYHYYNL